jgi:hypothetical protein
MRTKLKTVCLFCAILTLAACSANNVLTAEEIKIQNAADTAVAETLFDRELEKTASYHVRKSGFVALHFDKSVSDKVYTEVVKSLRANPAISGVYAEQEGKEICPLR